MIVVDCANQWQSDDTSVHACSQRIATSHPWFLLIGERSFRL